VILRRISQAFASRNLSTILLELVVVIFGIFLGLQVNDWNESRKLQQDEGRYLQKLADDLLEMREELRSKVDRSERARQKMMGALYALEDCTISDSARSDLDFALGNYQILGPFNYLNATYDEMVATGALARIADQGLKQKIAYAFARLADVNMNQDMVRVSLPVVDDIVWARVSYSIDRQSGRPIVTYDMAKLCGDVTFRNAIVEMIDIQWDGNVGARRALDSVDALIAILDVSASDVGH